jgi:hypothetical protein
MELLTVEILKISVMKLKYQGYSNKKILKSNYQNNYKYIDPK